MKKYKVSVVLGIRPDFIRTSKVLKLLDAHPEVDLTLIHTGQHYDENLNGVFFDEMKIPSITHQLDTRGKNHNEQHAKLILQLSDALENINPDVCLFLGDANAVVGAIAPLKLGIPIAHIEAGMRSYNWDMPEERNRVIIDRISDVLYVYQDDYRVQIVQEGIAPSKILVTGNVIVDVIEEYKDKIQWNESPCDICDNEKDTLYGFCSIHQIRKGKYALMTLHRNEHMTNPELAQNIINEVGRFTKEHNMLVKLIEMPRLKALGLKYPYHFIPTPPLGFFNFLCLEANAAIEFTDSGTNQEVASIVGTPCVTTRSCTERPECWNCGTTVMADWPDICDAAEYVLQAPFNKEFTLGDGRSSERIVNDLVKRLKRNFDRDIPAYIDLFKRNHAKVFHGASVNQVAYAH